MWQQMGPDEDSSAGYSRGGWVAGGGYDRPERVSDVMGRKTNMQWRIQLPGETGEGCCFCVCCCMCCWCCSVHRST
jgi:hypothetical protein